MDAESGKIEYHYGFYGAVRFEYRALRERVDFLQEHELGAKPIRLDMLIIKRGEALKDPIGRFFRKNNVLEYKSPEDSLTLADFYKAQGYACIYQSTIREERAIETMTVSLFRHTCPRGMFTELERLGCEVGEPHPGIYSVAGPLCVPAQVVVMSQLPDGEYEALKILAGNAREEDIAKFIGEVNDSDKNLENDIGAVLKVSIAANRALYRRLREEGLMTDAIYELFHEEFEAAEAKGRNEERRIITDKLIAAGWEPRDAASFTGLAL